MTVLMGLSVWAGHVLAAQSTLVRLGDCDGIVGLTLSVNGNRL